MNHDSFDQQIFSPPLSLKQVKMAMKRIPKKLVTKSTYHIFTIIFHLFCLAGSIWQITLVSVKFFKFDVTKNTHLVLPEEQDNSNNVFYVCFENQEYMDHKKYDHLMLDKWINSGKPRSSFKSVSDSYKQFTFFRLAVEDRFKISPKGRVTLSRIDTTDFISGRKYCTQVLVFNATRAVIILKRDIENVTFISLSIGNKLPGFDHKRLHAVNQLGERKEIISIGISSYSYKIQKLEKPYTDNCRNYSSTSPYSLRRLAIEYCKNKRSMDYENIISDYHVCYPGERHNNLSINMGSTDEEPCHKKYPQLDCIQSLYFTKADDFKLLRRNLKPAVVFRSITGKDPSFIIASKASIDNIDFLTYVLGALGAWIGFSFIGINPIPFVLKYSDDISVAENISSNEKKLWKEVITSRNMIFSLRQEISELKQKSATLEQNYKSEIARLNYTINQDCKADIAKLNDQMSKLIRDIYSKKL